LTAILVGLVLAVTGCGGDDGSSGGEASGTAGGPRCDLAIAFFGAQTGDAANLGINISNGVQLAVDQYNAEHPDCPVTLEKYDSEGLPDKASSLAQNVVQQKNVLGVVGPAFSGESEVANPIFNEAGVPLVSASATRPTLSTKGWRVFHRVLGNDSVQGPAAAKYVRDVVKAEKVFVVDDATVYGKDLATLVRSGLQDRVVGTDTIQQKQTDFSATVTKIKSSGATLVFFGGYYPEAGLLRKQLSDSGGGSITLMGGDGVRDQGFVDSAGTAAAEGTIATCACLPPEKAPGSFVADYQAAFDRAPGTYSAEAFDAANVLLDGIAAGRTTRPDMLSWVDAYDKQGITKHLRFDDRGEVADTTVWTYRFANGQIVADQAVK
jgi:branched-chain amino acid transport system substrate-binding protein